MKYVDLYDTLNLIKQILTDAYENELKDCTFTSQSTTNVNLQTISIINTIADLKNMIENIEKILGINTKYVEKIRQQRYLQELVDRK